MANLRVYFDESYNHRTDKEPDAPLVYTVAGYMAAVGLWNGFEVEWAEALDDANIPFFHMSEFENRLGPFKVWSNEKRIDFLRRLHEIINKYVFKGFATSVILSDYESLTEEQKFAFGEPHICGMINCMKHISKLCDDFDTIDLIDYVFEESVYNGKINKLFGDLPDSDIAGYRIASITFESKNCPPLQAADILAYEVTKEIVRQKTTGNKRPTRKSIMNLAIKGLDELHYMEREHFLDALTSAKQLGRYHGEI
jgi:Protein of unknown function (DUF3800)